MTLFLGLYKSILKTNLSKWIYEDKRKGSCHPYTMASLIAQHIETGGHKVMCISYKNSRSAVGDSVADMSIGRTQKRVGCSSVTLKNASPNDIVIINAETKAGRLFHIGVLTKRSDDFTTWLDHGGEIWKYNWEYDPITQDMPVRQCIDMLVEMGLTKTAANNLFNARLCKQTGLYQSYLAKLIREGRIPLYVRP